MQTESQRTSRLDVVAAFFLLLVVGDLFYVALHFVHLGTTHLQDTLFSIETDGGFSEWYQYIKEGWAVVLCFLVWRRTRALSLLGWALLFGYLLLDDSVQIHELGGESISRHLHYPAIMGLRAQDLGELTVSAIMGTVFLLMIGLKYFGESQNQKDISRDLVILVGVLVGFGVGVDAMHSIVSSVIAGNTLRNIFGFIEDGGELFAMSALCWYMFDLLNRDGIPSQDRIWTRTLGAFRRMPALKH